MTRTYSGDAFSVWRGRETGWWFVGYLLADGRWVVADRFDEESSAREDAARRNAIARQR